MHRRTFFTNWQDQYFFCGSLHSFVFLAPQKAKRKSVSDWCWFDFFFFINIFSTLVLTFYLGDDSSALVRAIPLAVLNVCIIFFILCFWRSNLVFAFKRGYFQEQSIIFFNFGRNKHWSTFLFYKI